jgi:predicted Zn-dependent protease
LAKADGYVVWWPYDDIRQTQGFYAGEQLRLERAGDDVVEALVVDDQSLLGAIHQVAPHVRFRFYDSNRMFMRAKLFLLYASGAIIVSAGMYFWGIPALAEAAAVRVPVSWEEKLGRAMVDQMCPPKMRCAGVEATGAINEIVSTLLASAPRSPYTFRVIVADYPAVNAFALPGGYIVVNRGLLQKVQTPEQVAGVLAHEMQHCMGHHPTKAVFRSLPIRALITVLSGNIEGTASILDTAGTLGELSYSRSDEEAADEGGMKMIEAAQIDPSGMITFLAMLEKDETDVPAQMRYLSTHPSTADRIAKLQYLASQAHYVPRKLQPEFDWAATAKVCSR